MNTIIYVILSIVGILVIVVYPALLKFALFGLLAYLTIFVNLYFSALFIPLLIIIYIFKKRKEKYG